MLRVVSLLGGLVAAACVLVLALAVNGGLAYRIDCAADNGGVARHWSYEWNQPIPYLLAPTQTGCEVHSATRLLVSSLGLFRVREGGAGDIAVRSAKSESLTSGEAYYATVYAIGVDVTTGLKAATWAGVDAKLEKGSQRLRSLGPPPPYLAALDMRFRRSYALLVDDERIFKSARTKANAASVIGDIGQLAAETAAMQKAVLAHR